MEGDSDTDFVYSLVKKDSNDNLVYTDKNGADIEIFGDVVSGYFSNTSYKNSVFTIYKEYNLEIEIIKEQIKVACGIPISGKSYTPEMCAIECRINAEDPFNNFRPSPGKITHFHSPGGHGVRVDTHVYAGYVIPPNYDSMIAKLICVAQTREEAINTMERALSEFVIEGIKTTIPFHLKLMKDPNFRAGNFTTKFMETFEFSEDK